MKLLQYILLSLSLMSATSTALAQDSHFSEEKRQQLLAPVALYPDTVLTHLLIAATYPLEVVQADRWSKAHSDLAGQEAVAAAADKPWDPSVKALLAFPDLLSRMSEDLLWTQELGDAFLASESDTLDSIQALRQMAMDNGTLEDMEHQEVVREDKLIIIQPVRREVVYIPYYDSRHIYGTWSWASSPPVYWSHPARYHSGFHWGVHASVSDWFYFGGFHWGQRSVVISYDRPYYYSRHRLYGYQTRNTVRWQHDPYHRRGARYQHDNIRHHYSNRGRPEVNQQLQHHSSRLHAIYGRGKDRSTITRNTTRNASPPVQRSDRASRIGSTQNQRTGTVSTSPSHNSRAVRRDTSSNAQATSRTRTESRQQSTRRETLQRTSNNRPTSRSTTRQSPSRNDGDRGGRLR
ncbi:DUF3300 domain-containing protein [Gilvimarinus agarilyticus]|uniref:DUF3300 domain-containing protein n=1 Tax=Gilvimarinus sp. 2_MG-2023 TaxID=3062666 RepID=UPI001C086D7E|nr:DUF3300 domain-containing protein [Gilvimarinus sp. 2_MG-2023]MBU2887859.1 DUF3300 domain-containing protein [Gilvimarinus agarilyticus]MDO6572497.1 DUF3300 domain-containing protein [Gilvimarinus sp. 2_MG-2023]